MDGFGITISEFGPVVPENAPECAYGDCGRPIYDLGLCKLHRDTLAYVSGALG